MRGETHLRGADWLLGFDFDGTLAEPEAENRVSGLFFETLQQVIETTPTAWGICTGRSLELILEGLEVAEFPFYPDFLVTKERDIYYLDGEQSYSPVFQRNRDALNHLLESLEKYQDGLNKVKAYVEEETQGQWFCDSEEPAGIVAKNEQEIATAIEIFNAQGIPPSELDYQRNSIYLRFSHPAYNKGTALQYLQRRHSCSKEKTLVMGDNYNDLSMLCSTVGKYFGAPSNALPELKEYLKQRGGFITQGRCALGVVEGMRIILEKSEKSAL